MCLMSNLVAGVGAGRSPEFIEMTQLGVSPKPGSAPGSLGGSHTIYENHDHIISHYGGWLCIVHHRCY